MTRFTDICPTCNKRPNGNQFCSDAFHILTRAIWFKIGENGIDFDMIPPGDILVGCWVAPHEEDDKQFEPYWASWVVVMPSNDEPELGHEGRYGLSPTHWTFPPLPPMNYN